MPAQRPEGVSSDLFTRAATAAAKAPAEAEVGASKVQPASATEPASQRHLLPKDLPGALKHLNDGELDALHDATLDELKRRNRLPSRLLKEAAPTHEAPHQPQPPSDDGALTRGQLNAVRAAFKAGVKPSTIARQFGISQSDVRKAIAAEGRTQKSGR